MSPPAPCTVALVAPDGSTHTLRAPAAAFLLDTACAAGVRLPCMCLQGWCLSCAGRVEEGTAECVDHSAAARYFAEDCAEGFVLLCSARPRAPCRIATHQAEAMRAHRRRRRLPSPGG